MLPRGWPPAAQRMAPCCSEDGPLLLRGWPPAAQRMVPGCSEDGPRLLRGPSPAAQRTVPCCSEDGPLLLRGWSPAAQRMVPCCSEDGHQDGPLVRLSSSVIMLLSDVLEHCIQTAAGILRMVDYEEHECVPTLTPEEEKHAAGLLKRAISTSPDKAI